MASTRVDEPNRSQVVAQWSVAEDALPPEHPARVLWQITGSFDLSQFLVGAKAFEGGPGRSVLSPRMKLALWLYAITQGIGSAREIARRTKSDIAFHWIVGNLNVGHHTLSGFRAEQGRALDKLMTDIIAALMHKGILSLELVAQDGLRVRASASSPSFRSVKSLEECREQARLHLKAVLSQADDTELTRRQKKAREAAARDFERRVGEALDVVKELQESGKREKPRASTTDAEARVMKMADGGFRPGYNVQLATAGSPMGGPRTVVGVQITNIGSDMGAVTPMLDDIERRTGSLPEKLLADSNHTSHDGIRDATARGVEVIIAVPETSKSPTSEQANRDPAIVAWRERMKTEEAQNLYRARAGLCELMNAIARRYGLEQLPVRGRQKVTSFVLLIGIAMNLMQHAATLLRMVAS
jgi:transposase